MVSANKRLTRYFGKAVAIHHASALLHPFLFDWMLVMLVTFTEAYLENILLLLTKSRPKVMEEKEMVLSSVDVLQVEGTS